MEGMDSMSHLMFNQVEQIADVKTCNLDNVEQRFYKVQWKCTWEPAIVLEKFCGTIIADYEKGPNSCKNQTETVEKTKQHNFEEGNARANLTKSSVDAVDNYEETEHFEDTCNLFSSSNNFKESQLQSDNIEQSQMSLNRLNKELDETYRVTKVQSVVNKTLSTANNKLSNNLNLHNFDIKTESDKEPDETCTTNNDNNSINESIPPYNFDINHASLIHNIVEKESGTTSKDQSNGFLLSLDSADLITEGVIINTNVESRNIRRNQLENHCFKCQLCSYSSPKRSVLKRHMLKHTGEKPFKCSLCSYSASQKYNIKIHMSKHTGDYRFKCDLCPYSTNVHADLKRHLMTHTGEKPFKCEQCDYRTILKAHLKRHMKVHPQVVEI